MSRSRKHNRADNTTLKMVRCAIYTRKSTDQGLEQEFNSLDAQREACEAFIASQRHEGWSCLPDRYDDGGWSGASTDRPGLQRLLADIEAGKVDQVVCYKIDRLSRSLLDFSQLMQVFEKHGIGFISVTQSFNTATSMGRLVLNVLLSFAQFEREIIGERTRDKIAMTRRKGRWTGGQPILGYDVDKERTRLIVNEEEAERVRAIFALYLEHQGLLPVVQELAKREWTTKRWTTRQSDVRGGQPFTKTSLHRLLTNVAYTGKTRYREELHQGEHAAIVDPLTFQRVQATLARNAVDGGGEVRNGFGAILKGILKCGPCNCAMSPTHTTRGSTRYRYYRCQSAVQRGKDACPCGAVPAGQIEQVVVERLRGIGRDPALRAEILEQARQQSEARNKELAGEQRSLERDLTTWSRDLLKLSGQLRPDEDNRDVVGRLAELQGRIGQVEGRVKRVRQQIAEAQKGLLDEDEAADALALFDPVWAEMTPREQARVVGLLVEEVVYDGTRGKVTITFHPTGIKTLAEELADKQQHQQRQRA
jgi:site-specific DNA recombinase